MPTTTEWIERELDCLRQIVECQRELLAASSSDAVRRQRACELRKLESEAIWLARVLVNLEMRG